MEVHAYFQMSHLFLYFLYRIGTGLLLQLLGLSDLFNVGIGYIIT